MTSPTAQKSRKGTILDFLEERAEQPPLASLSEYVKQVQEVSERWQKEDWKRVELDDDMLFNDVRIVGQVWFRGQRDLGLTLRPGLYRQGTYQYLAKHPGSPKPKDEDPNRIDELFDLEHEMRVDFTSFGHLLKQANQAETAADWYFLMQHHGLPTRLLDWTTNALAALFFALDGHKQSQRGTTESDKLSAKVDVWVVDAYWLSDRLSSEWSAPLLAWSSDADRYIPPMESLIDKMRDSKALLPRHAMPIEPPSVHPRVASQEGRFIIFGQTEDLVDEEIRLDQLEDCSGMEEMRLARISFQTDDIDGLLRELAQLGVSRRTLFPDLTGLADFVRWKHTHALKGYTL
jgi:hypothetical protein